MDKPKPLTFPTRQKKWNIKKTETLNEAIETSKSRLGWIIVLLFLILIELADISDKLGD